MSRMGFGYVQAGAVLILVLVMASCAGWSDTFAPKQYAPLAWQVIYQGPATQPVDPPPGQAWRRFANHTHTTYSGDGHATVEERIRGAAQEGAEAISITDHRNSDQCSDPFFMTLDGCTPMCGEEWGWDGHVNLLNITPGDPMADWTVEQMIPAALSRGATLVVNHPRFTGHDEWQYDDLQLGITGVEAWNMLYFITNSATATAWWDGMLQGGRVLFAIGGSDNHTTSAITLQPCNYVLSASADPAVMQQAIAAGRITISRDQNAGRCFVWCDADGDGAFETPMGAVVSATARRALHFRVEVYGGSGLTLMLYHQGGSAGTFTVGTGNPWCVDLAAEADAATKDFLRAELPNPAVALSPMEALTNPIYINYTPGDADGDGLSDAFEQAIGSDKYKADTDGDGVSDAFEAGYDGDPTTYNPYDPSSNPSGTDLNLLVKDTDGDGFTDAQELTYGTNPLDPASKPTLPAGSRTILVILLGAIGLLFGKMAVKRPQTRPW